MATRTVRIEVDESAVIYVIEAQCKNGCPEHAVGQWRKSKMLPSGITYEEAVKAMDAYAVEFWKSKPYRLVERIVLPEPILTRVLSVLV